MKKMPWIYFGGLALVLGGLLSCSKSLPEKLPIKRAEYRVLKTWNDSTTIEVESLLPGAIAFYLDSDQAAIDSQLQQYNPILLSDEVPKKKITVKHPGQNRPDIQPSLFFGHPDLVRKQEVLQWPFPRGRRYKIIQAYNGNFSHNTDFSRYAIDFDLAIGDTVCAAADGLVMEVIQGYDIGGNSREYRPYANFITILHPDGYLTQYVHLQHQSALVEAGDRVRAGQPVGLSGETGFTTTPHLHFNVLKPVYRGVVSTPCRFTKRDGAELRRGQVVGH